MTGLNCYEMVAKFVVGEKRKMMKKISMHTQYTNSLNHDLIVEASAC